MPISDPRALVGLISALARDLDAGDRFASLHDRLDNVFDRLGQSRYAFPNGTPQVVLNGDAAYFCEATVDMQITAVGREESETNRRRVISQLQGRLRVKRQIYER